MLLLATPAFAKIQTTTWSPDTCECVIEYQWDDTISQEERVHTPSNIVKTCPVHSALPDKEKKYTEVLKENQTKNKAVGIILEGNPQIGTEDISFSYDPDRTLRLKVNGLDTTKKKSVETEIKSKVGNDKIIVE